MSCGVEGMRCSKTQGQIIEADFQATTTDPNVEAFFDTSHPGFSKAALSTPCMDCRDPACWKGCHDVWNPFGQFGKDLKKLLDVLPPDSHWHDARVREEVAHWTYRMYASYYRRSKWCRELLNQMAEEMRHDMYHGTFGHNCKNFNGSPRSLPNILGLVHGFDFSQDLLKQLHLGLAKLEEYLESLWKRETAERKKLTDEGFGQVMPAIEEEPAHPFKSPSVENNTVTLSRTSSFDTVIESPPHSKEEHSSSKDSWPIAPIVASMSDGSCGLEQTSQPRRTAMRSDLNSDGEVYGAPLSKQINAATDSSNLSPSLETNHQWDLGHSTGSLTRLGLTVGQYNLNITAPQGKNPIPPALHLEKSGKNPSVRWVCYVILTRIPGGWMSSSEIENTALEWCSPPCFKRRSIGHALTGDKDKPPEFILEERDGVKGWRIGNKGETRMRRHGPGHPKHESSVGRINMGKVEKEKVG